MDACKIEKFKKSTNTTQCYKEEKSFSYEEEIFGLMKNFQMSDGEATSTCGKEEIGSPIKCTG